MNVSACKYLFVLTESSSYSPSTGTPAITVKKEKRTRDQEVPLPNPYPLPQHFPAVVEAGIAAENSQIVPKFLSCLASSMLCYKQYPTRDEYVQVAQQVIDKYKWMRAKLGPPTVSC